MHLQVYMGLQRPHHRQNHRHGQNHRATKPPHKTTAPPQRPRTSGGDQARDDITGDTSKYYTMARMGLP